MHLVEHHVLQLLVVDRTEVDVRAHLLPGYARSEHVLAKEVVPVRSKLLAYGIDLNIQRLRVNQLQSSLAY